MECTKKGEVKDEKLEGWCPEIEDTTGKEGCVCVCVHMCAHMCACVYVYVCMRVCVHVCWEQWFCLGHLKFKMSLWHPSRNVEWNVSLGVRGRGLDLTGIWKFSRVWLALKDVYLVEVMELIHVKKGKGPRTESWDTPMLGSWPDVE